MKYELNEEVETKTPDEVAQDLVRSGAIELDDDEIVEQARLECGCDLEVDIYKEDHHDPRASYYHRTMTFTQGDLRDEFSEAEFVAWATDEEGNNVLLCFV